MSDHRNRMRSQDSAVAEEIRCLETRVILPATKATEPRTDHAFNTAASLTFDK